MALPINDTLNIRVVNNTNLPQRANILGGTQDPLSVPPNRIYEWDLSTETYFGSVTATIVISNTSNPTPVTYTVQVNGYNIQAVAFALNTLNKGFFQSSGSTLYVSNDYYIYGALGVVSSAFTSTWDTTFVSGSSSASNQIQLPLISGGTYNFTVDWGDGTQDVITSWNQPETLHTYAVGGIYTLQLLGTITEWSFGNAVVSDLEKINSISAWGLLQFGTIVGKSFQNCIYLDLSSVTDLPDLSATVNLESCFESYQFANINRIDEWDISLVTNISQLFYGTPLFDGNISSWNTSSVTNMLGVFYSATNFNQPLNWNTGNVTDMSYMFSSTVFFNQPLNSWNTANVLNMTFMFNGANSFDQPLNLWDVTNVSDMSFMFAQAFAFNGNIGSWNTGNVLDMQYMFNGATNFNYNISSWNTTNVTNMAFMFYGANFNQPLNSWSVISVQNMSSMFEFNTVFNQPLNSWLTNAVTDMSSMFKNCSAFNQNISSWNTSQVINFVYMFQGATLFNQPLNSWNLSSAVGSMSNMFDGCINFNQPLNSWIVDNIVDMGSMFYNCLVFNQSLNSWNVNNVISMSQMFASATPNVFNGNITSWNTGSVTNMFAMFNGASLFNQNIGAWDVSKVQNMVGMFLATQTFNNGGSPSINGWITSSLKFCYSMFQSCVFNQPIGGWDVSNVVTMQDMFNGNNVFNQDIGSWDVSNVGSFSNFMLGKTFTDYSTTNLNSIYNNWSLLTVQPNLTNVNFGSIKYTLAGQAGKTILESAPNNWQILDGGI